MSQSFGIAELAERGGVSRRTVRYYVQRGLLPPPTGVGRGKHYTEEHLGALLRVKDLQAEGVPLAEIASRLSGEAPSPASPPAIDRPTQSHWTRVAIGDDIELHVRGRRLGEDTLRALADAVAAVIGEESR